MDTQQDHILRSPYPDIEYVEQDIWSYLQPNFLANKDKTALVCMETDRKFTYQDYFDLSLRWAVELQKLNLGENPIISLCTRPRVETAFLIYGTLAAGGCVSSMMHQCPEELMATILKKSEPDVIVIEKTMGDVIVRLRKHLNLDFKIIFIEDLVEVCLNLDHEQEDPVDVFKSPKIDPDSPAFIFFSSGTTGTPKAIVHSHKSFLNFSLSLSSRDEFKAKNEEERYHFSSTPMAHLSGVHFVIMMPAILGDCSVVEYRPDISFAKDFLRKFKSPYFFMRPYHLNKFVDDPDTPELFKKFRCIVTGGLAPDVNVQKKLHKLAPHIQFIDGYGSTEVSVVTMTPISSEPITPGTVPFPNCEIQIRDLNTGAPVGPNTTGEIFIKNRNHMLGYLNDKKATEAAFDENGWFIIGDLGYFTDDEQLVVTDRVVDKITVGGKMVIPSNIEKIITSHPFVKEAYVIGIPDVEKEQIPRAYVLTPKDNVTPEELIEYVNARVNIPEERLEGGLEFKDSFIKTSLGKVSRKHLRAYAWYGTE